MKRCLACNYVLKQYLSCGSETVLICTACGLGELKKKPTQTKAVTLYKKFYDEKESERFESFFESLIVLFRKLRVGMIERFTKKKGTILDVGFGRPIDLEVFNKNSWSAYGTQLVPHVVKIAKRKKLNAFLGELHDAHYSQNFFDVVTMWHVLEHLNQPESYIREAHRILKKNGALIVEVPNFNSFVAKVYGCNWFELDVPHHVFQFTPRSLTRLLERNGFIIKKKSFFSLEQSPFSMIQSSLNVFFKRNALFELMKKNKIVSAPVSFLNAVLAVLLLPIAVPLSIIFALFRKGDVMRFYCIKK